MNKKAFAIMMVAVLATLAFCSGCASAPSATPVPTYPTNYDGLVSEMAPSATSAPSGSQVDGFGGSHSGESYLSIDENREKTANEDSVVTFSLKVDTASYSNVARYLQSGNLPPADAVRVEELLNYFRYEQPVPITDGPFGVYTEVAPSPFESGKYLAMVRVKTADIDRSELPRSNLVFLIDTSGSMDSYDKLPLLKQAFSLLVETLTEDDKVSIVTYAGTSSVVLDSASGSDKERILSAIQNLSASGSTAGAQGIQTAYALAEKNYRQDGNNRVILATDGDFNVGLSSTDDLASFISGKKESGVYLSVLGFGTGNIRDDIMETLSKSGNGNYSYINTVSTAKKVLVEELAANLYTVANDVKAQVEFNPQNVKSYRLIGYENRQLNNQDFADDTKDAGEVGAGTDLVLLFELELSSAQTGVDLKYQSTPPQTSGQYADELFEVRIRYKDPGAQESKLIVSPVSVGAITDSPSADFHFASAVSAFGHLLRGSNHAGNATPKSVYELAESSMGSDTSGYRWEFVSLLNTYRQLVGQ